MHVNNEQTNTQKMLQHNQTKERVVSGGSLQRKLVDVAVNNLDMRESTILNCDNFSADLLKNLVAPADQMSPGQVRSDADAQLIVKLKFNEKVDCSSISFYPPLPEEEEDVSNARQVKIFVNQNNLDFSDVENLSPVAHVELPFEYSEGKPFVFQLAGAKFTRIQSLQLFVEDNYGTDLSRLGRIKIEGFLAPTYHTEYK